MKHPNKRLTCIYNTRYHSITKTDRVVSIALAVWHPPHAIYTFESLQAQPQTESCGKCFGIECSVYRLGCCECVCLRAYCRMGGKQVPMSMSVFEHSEGITLISEYVKNIMRNQLKFTVSSYCLVSNLYNL